MLGPPSDACCRAHGRLYKERGKAGSSENYARRTTRVGYRRLRFLWDKSLPHGTRVRARAVGRHSRYREGEPCRVHRSAPSPPSPCWVPRAPRPPTCRWCRPVRCATSRPRRHRRCRSPSTAPCRPARSPRRAFRVFGRGSGTASGPFTFSNGNQTVTLTPTRAVLGRRDRAREPRRTTIVAADTSPLRSAGYAFQFRIADPAGVARCSRRSTRSRTARARASRRASTAPWRPTSNDDGYLDLTTVNEVSADVRVFLNRADGTGLFDPFLTPPQPIGVESSPNEPADFDNDGKIDIAISADRRRQRRGSLLGNGDGTFGPAQTIAGRRPSRTASPCSTSTATATSTSSTPTTAATTSSLMLNNGSGVFGAADVLRRRRRRRVRARLRRHEQRRHHRPRRRRARRPDDRRAARQRQRHLHRRDAAERRRADLGARRRRRQRRRQPRRRRREQRQQQRRHPARQRRRHARRAARSSTGAAHVVGPTSATSTATATSTGCCRASAAASGASTPTTAPAPSPSTRQFTRRATRRAPSSLDFDNDGDLDMALTDEIADVVQS